MLCFVTQSCLTLCNLMACSLLSSPDQGILQARTLEWVAISFSNAWKWKMKVKSLSRVWFSATPWTAACQAPPSMGFSRQEYWSGLPLPSSHLLYTHIELPYLLHLANMKKRAIAVDESVNCVHHSKLVLWGNYCFKLSEGQMMSKNTMNQFHG